MLLGEVMARRAVTAAELSTALTTVRSLAVDVEDVLQADRPGCCWAK
jgi:hypothetical protein